jgi:hypothetical protein
MANQVVYGFQNLSDIFGQRVTAVGVDVVNDAITQARAEHDRQINSLMGIFVRNVDTFQTTYGIPANVRNQPLTEDGRPNPIKGAAQYSVAFPLQMSGQAIGYNYVTFNKLTVEDVNRDMATVLMGDMRWMFDHMLGALFANTTYTWWSKETGDLTIQPLANGDSVTYNVFTGADTGATDTHQLAQANTLGNGADNMFATLYAELAEHPENAGGDFIAFIGSGLKSAATGLTTFNPVADPNVTPGANSDRLTGTLGVNLPGRLIGYDDSGMWVVEYPRLPANYILAVATGGEPPLGLRQDPEPALRGFAEVPAENDPTLFPHLRRTWIRRAGFGAWNRVSAAVGRVGNGTYAVPTGFTVPMP